MRTFRKFLSLALVLSMLAGFALMGGMPVASAQEETTLTTTDSVSTKTLAEEETYTDITYYVNGAGAWPKDGDGKTAETALQGSIETVFKQVKADNEASLVFPNGTRIVVKVTNGIAMGNQTFGNNGTFTHEDGTRVPVIVEGYTPEGQTTTNSVISTCKPASEGASYIGFNNDVTLRNLNFKANPYKPSGSDTYASYITHTVYANGSDVVFDNVKFMTNANVTKAWNIGADMAVGPVDTNAEINGSITFLNGDYSTTAVGTVSANLGNSWWRSDANGGTIKALPNSTCTLTIGEGAVMGTVTGMYGTGKLKQVTVNLAGGTVTNYNGTATGTSTTHKVYSTPLTTNVSGTTFTTGAYFGVAQYCDVNADVTNNITGGLGCNFSGTHTNVTIAGNLTNNFGGTASSADFFGFRGTKVTGNICNNLTGGTVTAGSDVCFGGSVTCTVTGDIVNNFSGTAITVKADETNSSGVYFGGKSAAVTNVTNNITGGSIEFTDNRTDTTKSQKYTSVHFAPQGGTISGTLTNNVSGITISGKLSKTTGIYFGGQTLNWKCGKIINTLGIEGQEGSGPVFNTSASVMMGGGWSIVGSTTADAKTGLPETTVCTDEVVISNTVYDITMNTGCTIYSGSSGNYYLSGSTVYNHCTVGSIETNIYGGTMGSFYGGGYAAPVYGKVTTNIYGGTFANIHGGTGTGNVYDGVELNIYKAAKLNSGAADVSLAAYDATGTTAGSQGLVQAQTAGRTAASLKIAGETAADCIIGAITVPDGASVTVENGYFPNGLTVNGAAAGETAIASGSYVLDSSFAEISLTSAAATPAYVSDSPDDLQPAITAQQVGATAWNGQAQWTIGYDDYIYFPDCTDITVTSGSITSYKAWTTEKDTALLTRRDGAYVATACGTGTVTLKDKNGTPVTVNITVEAAPLSFFTIIGHSLGAGEGSVASQSVLIPAGQAYSTYEANYKNSSYNPVVTNLDDVTGYGLGYGSSQRFSNVEAFSAYGSGTKGVGSGLAYQWNKLTGEKVWVLNAAYGGSQLDQWRSRTDTYRDEYAHFQSVYTKAMQVLDAEVTAGHYTLSHNSVVLHNCANGDEYWDEEEYITAFRDEMLAHLNEDTVFTVGGKETKMECLALAPSYSLYSQSRLNTAKYLSAYAALSEDYPQVIMGARNPAQWTVQANVQAFFAGKTPEYSTHSGQQLTYPTTASETFYDTIHFNEVCYNEEGMEEAQSIYNYFYGIEAADVEIVDANGLEDIGDSVMMTTGKTMRFAAFIEPAGSDNVTYTVTGGAVTVDEKGVFTAVQAGTATVTVKAASTGKALRTVTFYVSDAEIDKWDIGATVYVDGTDGSDTNDGLTAATAVRTLKAAYGKLKTAMDGAAGNKAGKVVLVSDVALPAEDYVLEGDTQGKAASVYGYQLPHTDFPVVIGSVTGAEALVPAGHVMLNGPTVLDNCTVHKTSTSSSLVAFQCKGYTFVATENLKSTSVNSAYYSVLGGYYNAQTMYDTDIQLHGGTWQLIYVRDVGSCNYGSGSVLIDGATVVKGAVCSGYSSNHVTTVAKQIHTQPHTGDLNIRILGGTVAALYTANYSSNTLTGNVNITVGTGATVSKFAASSGTSTNAGTVSTTVLAPTDGTTGTVATAIGDEIFVDAVEGSVVFTTAPTGTVTTNAKVKIGNRFFGNTVASALEAYQTGETVTLLADITEDVEIPETVTVDYNGFTITGTSSALPGDMNGDGEVTSDDAIYLLKYVFSPASYPIGEGLNPDCNGSGEVNSDDAIYLLKYVFSPASYPLS